MWTLAEVPDQNLHDFMSCAPATRLAGLHYRSWHLVFLSRVVRCYPLHIPDHTVNFSVISNCFLRKQTKNKIKKVNQIAEKYRILFFNVVSKHRLATYPGIILGWIYLCAHCCRFTSSLLLSEVSKSLRKVSVFRFQNVEVFRTFQLLGNMTSKLAESKWEAAERCYRCYTKVSMNVPQNDKWGIRGKKTLQDFL